MQKAKKTTSASRMRLSAEQRRESILEAAAEVFTARGYRAAKMSDVAARLGVSEPVIFQNFGSKTALYAAVLDRVAAQIRSDIQALAGHYGSAAGLLAHVLDPSHAPPHHGPGSAGVLFSDAVTLIGDPELSEPAKRAVRAVTGHLADLVRRGQADGGIPAGVDPEAAAWVLLSIVATRNLRAALVPDGRRLETGITMLALAALFPGRADGTPMAG